MSNEPLEQILAELTLIRSLLERISKDTLRHDLESVATTKERRAIWTNLDGLQSTDEVSQKTGVSQRAVQIFVRELLESDLISMERRGYPKRRFDYVPSSWRLEDNG